MKTVNIFCAKDQKVTPHKGSIAPNGDFVFECQNVLSEAVLDKDGEVKTPAVLCDRFVKFPADTKVEDFKQLVQTHEEVNKGQVSVEEQEKTLNSLLDSVSNESES